MLAIDICQNILYIARLFGYNEKTTENGTEF